MKILWGLTGSVAATLFTKINTTVEENEFETDYVLTESSKSFINISTKDYPHIHDNQSEWNYYRLQHKVLHIDLTKEADVFIIAPCSANTLAKIANGISDNLLTSCARAYDFKDKNKKFIIATSMNTKMYEHPVTQEHLELLKSWGVIIIPPITKELFCGDFGMGAMANINTIIKKILK